MPNNQIDLAGLFGQVANALVQRQSSLNQADSYNQNHGDNMVQIFNLISQALEQKKDASPSAQLKYASGKVAKIGSTTAKVYAKGLAQAAKDTKGKSLDSMAIMKLVLDLIGGGQKVTKSSDPLSTILTGLSGSQKSGGSGQGLDIGDLIGAGLSYLSAKQGGESDLNALGRALVSNSPLTEAPHREQSGEVVMTTILNALSSMTQRK